MAAIVIRRSLALVVALVSASIPKLDTLAPCAMWLAGCSKDVAPAPIELRTETFPLAHAKALEIARNVLDLFVPPACTSPYARGDLGPIRVLTANPQENSVTITAEPIALGEIGKLIREEWDLPRAPGKSRLYTLEHADAVVVAGKLRALLGASFDPQPAKPVVEPDADEAQAIAELRAHAAEDMPPRRVRVAPLARRNALAIHCPEPHRHSIRELIEHFDRPIDLAVIVAEIQTAPDRSLDLLEAGALDTTVNEALRTIDERADVRIASMPRVVTGHAQRTEFLEIEAPPGDFTASLDVQPRFAGSGRIALDICLAAGSAERREKRLEVTVGDGRTAIISLPLREGERLPRRLPLVAGTPLLGLATKTPFAPTTLVAFVTPRLGRAIADDRDDQGVPPPP